MPSVWSDRPTGISGKSRLHVEHHPEIRVLRVTRILERAVKQYDLLVSLVAQDRDGLADLGDRREAGGEDDRLVLGRDSFQETDGR